MIRRGVVLLVSSLALAAVAVAGATAAPAKTAATGITGAGSSFVFPLVSTWIPAVDHAFGYQLTYGSIGSGGGIAAITARTVDFGASDAPLTPDQMAACKGCVQIPWALSGTSIAYNLPGVSARLKLTGKLLADIFLGKIGSWNDPAIRAVNKGTTLPATKITPVFRSDGSGTSYNFTDYLSTVSPEWKSKVGKGTQVSFPAGVGARGSSGVTGVVSRIEGAVTYVDVAYALANKIRFAAVQNRAGRFQLPGLRGIAAAASTVKRVPASGALSIVDPPKTNKLAYPISTFSWIIMPTQSSKAAELRKFVFWALTQGQQKQYTAKLLFVPVPKPVLVAAEKTLKKISV